MVNALLLKAQTTKGNVTHIGSWKAVKITEYKEEEENDNTASAGSTDFDDSVVRIENCPTTINIDDIRHLLSRYELLEVLGRPSIYLWTGKTPDNKRPSDAMYIVKFKDPSWARAAIRENQNLSINGKHIKLIQYPKQLTKNEQESKQQRWVGK
jgi:RNA recognition motif-containing protein